MKKDFQKNKITRFFTKLSAAGVLGAALSGCGHAPVSPMTSVSDMVEGTNNNHMTDVNSTLASTSAKALNIHEKYVTQYSEFLDNMEQNANAQNLTDQKIILLDRDEAVRISVEESQYFFISSLKEQLKEQGVAVNKYSLGEMAFTMGSYTVWANPNAMTYGDQHNQYGPLEASSTEKSACVIIPQTMDLHGINAVWGYFGSDDMIRADLQIDAKLATKRTNSHEIWHCRDTKYKPTYLKKMEEDLNPLDTAHYRHKVELFADVAAALQMYVDGDATTTPLWSDLRSLRTQRQGEYFAKTDNPRVDPSYYSAGHYFTAPGLDAVTAHVAEFGQDTVSKYTVSDIKRIAEDITEQYALTQEQMVALSKYLIEGEVFLKQSPKNTQSFLNDFKSRLAKAEQHLVTDDPDQGVKRMKMIGDPRKYLETVSEQTRQDVKDSLTKEIDKYQGRVASAYLSLLESWRTELHGASEYNPILQTKIITLDALLRTGYVNQVFKSYKTSTNTNTKRTQTPNL